jgi:hypothetical protein
MEILTMSRKIMATNSSSVSPKSSTFHSLWHRENFSHKIFDGLIVKIGGSQSSSAFSEVA